MPARFPFGVVVNPRLAAARAELARKPNDRFALYCVAMELRKDGDLSASVEAFEVLLAAHPDFGAGYYHLGVTLRMAEQTPRAREVLATGRQACLRSGDGKTLGEIDGLLASFDDEDED